MEAGMRCKVGDVARVVRPRLEANQGMLVEVLRPGGRDRWWVRSLAGPRPTHIGAPRAEAVVPDDALRPVRGAGGRQLSLI